MIYQPILVPPGGHAAATGDAADAGTAIGRYLYACATFAAQAFAAPAAGTGAASCASPDDIIALMTDREFNYQSRGRVSPLLPEVTATVAQRMAVGQPIALFVDYGGGYHATTCPAFSEPLGFEAGSAELLLLYQAARLQHRIAARYAPGIELHVVLDNGVAAYVNDIPLAATEAYARQLDALIAALGASGRVRVLLQSSLGDFCAAMHGRPAPPAATITPEAHHNVERFLGRACSEAEARLRVGRYAAAEAVWERQLRSLIGVMQGVRLLQRASAEFLSFRSFPGGAARAQTGQIGFRLTGEKVVPTLVTTTTVRAGGVIPVPVTWPPIAGRQSAAAPLSDRIEA